MDTGRITGAGFGAESVVRDAPKELGKEDFLRLLTVQLRYQDPLNPLGNTEFIAQMAQFTSLEQLQNMNGVLEKSVGAQARLHGKVEQNMAAALIGRSVEVPTREIGYDGSSDSRLAYRLPAEAVAARVRILDATGRQVQAIELDAAQTTGSLLWNGRSAGGEPVPAGVYRVAIEAHDHAGAPLPAVALRRMQVEGVRYTASGTILWGDGMELSLDELHGVMDSRE